MPRSPTEEAEEMTTKSEGGVGEADRLCPEHKGKEKAMRSRANPANNSRPWAENGSAGALAYMCKDPSSVPIDVNKKKKSMSIS